MYIYIYIHIHIYREREILNGGMVSCKKKTAMSCLGQRTGDVRDCAIGAVAFGLTAPRQSSETLGMRPVGEFGWIKKAPKP